MPNNTQKVILFGRETPLEFLPNLSKHLGPKIYIKRDDEGGRGGGGNKLRKYERLVADALATNCDTLIIAGHYQSNASRALVGVACQFGLKSIVVCKELIPEQNSAFNKSGNALLMNLMDAEIVAIEKDDDYQIAMMEVAERIKNSGGKPYIIPFGGSNLLGALGYVDCANEIIDQFERLNTKPPDYVFVALGSGGTQAGLLAGFMKKNYKSKIIGISVLHSTETARNIVSDLTNEVINNISLDIDTAPKIIIDDKFVGEGYGVPTVEGLKAIKLLAMSEGLFLDPVYTGKAMSGLIAYIASGRITKDDTVVFIHTGGIPLLHAYYDKLFE
ncbi:MAG: D-cysteine desulfhydrase family protein [Bacteroidales bacterium]|jgi:D-cysteine desulfhydrase family pyridoxal phosphate-dependent enzyme|nr:D-cysteine desulfhydrase family protein [Bacteroidales bacterium]